MPEHHKHRSRQLLLVEDDEIFAEVLGQALSRRGFDVTILHSVASAQARITASYPDYAVIDLRVGAESGLGVVQQLADQNPGAHTIVLTGYGSIATAVEAIKLGATQYLTKPAEIDEIVAALEDRPLQRVAEAPSQPPSVRRVEWEHIQRVLAEHDGNISATARALGMHRRTLQRKLQKRPVRK